MERGREVKTNHSKNIELDKQVAEIMGLKLRDYGYKSVEPSQGTIFTSPPAFSTDQWTVKYMMEFMKKKGIEIPKWTYDPEKFAQAIVDSKRKKEVKHGTTSGVLSVVLQRSHLLPRTKMESPTK